MNTVKLVSFIAAMFFGQNLFGQDIIVSTNGDSLNCKIVGLEDFAEEEDGYLIFKRPNGSQGKMPLVLINGYKQGGNWKFPNQIRYQDLTQEQQFNKWVKYVSYVSKQGDVYKVGDTLRINKPSGNNGSFVYISSFDIMGQILPVASNRTNTVTVIKNIRVGGSKRTGWKVSFQTQGGSLIDNYFFFIEDAIASEEIEPKSISSDKALEELKRAKDKLDLELISPSEYETIRERLKPFIK